MIRRTLERRWSRRISTIVTLVLLAFALVRLYATLTVSYAGQHGVDYAGYMAGTRRWLETGTPYNAWEVAGPFDYGPHTFLHPPVAVLWFLPFTYLPWFVWWAIPIGAIVWAFNVWRPAWWSWPILAAIVAAFTPAAAFTTGNTNMWVCAAVALGLILGWPALVIFMKPSLFPFALIGSWSRWWWVGAAVGLVICIPFGSLWIDWIKVVVNSPGDLLYSRRDFPWMMAPVVAWFAATRPRPTWSHRKMRSPLGILARP